MSVTKIVITGGPCAGKSTAMSRIQSELTQLGYKVYFITESATEVITSGVTPDLNNFQKHLLQYQLDKEKMYENIAKDNEAKTVIVLDRGVLDSKIYMQPGEFERICKELNTQYNTQDVCLIVYEKPDNPCSERTGLVRWFKEHNIELVEWTKTSKVI